MYNLIKSQIASVDPNNHLIQNNNSNNNNASAYLNASKRSSLLHFIQFKSTIRWDLIKQVCFAAV
jgi:hypothetical protein